MAPRILEAEITKPQSVALGFFRQATQPGIRSSRTTSLSFGKSSGTLPIMVLKLPLQNIDCKTLVAFCGVFCETQTNDHVIALRSCFPQKLIEGFGRIRLDSSSKFLGPTLKKRVQSR